MRTTFRVIAAAFALLLATPALGASEFDIANAEHDANGGTNGAKRTTPVDASGNSLVSGGIKSNVVDTSGDSAVDATANAIKTVDVDNAGTALTGGRGSRVELLASGTDTTITASTTLYDVTVPAWCHSLEVFARVASNTGGTNLAMSAAPFMSSSFSGGFSSDVTTSTIAGPVATHSLTIGLGPSFPFASTTTLTTNSHYRVYSVYLARFVRITRVYGGSTPSAQSLEWSIYCIGG